MPYWSERFRRFQRAFVFCVQFRESKGGWTPFRLGFSHGWKERFFSSSSAMCIDFFKPQTHQHWTPRRLRLKFQQNLKEPKCTRDAPSMKEECQKEAKYCLIVREMENDASENPKCVRESDVRIEERFSHTESLGSQGGEENLQIMMIRSPTRKALEVSVARR